MPIAQTRIIAVIDEADAILAAFRRLRTTVLEQARLATGAQPPLTLAEFCGILQVFVANEVEPPHYALFAEQRHFAKNEHRNDKERQRQRNLRLQSAMGLGDSERQARLTLLQSRATPRKAKRGNVETWEVDGANEDKIVPSNEAIFAEAAPQTSEEGLNAILSKGQLMPEGETNISLDVPEPTEEELAKDLEFAAELRSTPRRDGG